MKQFNSIEEMEKYLNKETVTYEFIENGERIDIEITFDLTINVNILASNINAGNINARDINAYDIKACDINACDIDARNIKARDIISCDINALNIEAQDIKAWDIKANTIRANTILFDVVCCAYNSIICEYIKGKHKNSKYFALYGEVIIKEEK